MVDPKNDYSAGLKEQFQFLETDRFETGAHHLGSYQCPVKSNRMARQPGNLIKIQILLLLVPNFLGLKGFL